MFGQIVQDFRHACRVFKRSKGLALGVVVSMGFGLGATASMFSLADFFVFRPVTVPQTDRLVRITNATAASSVGSLSYFEYQDYVARNRSFSGIATYETPLIALATNPNDAARAAVGMPVSGNFFSVMQVKPAVGRDFLPEEDEVPGRDAVAVISYKVWQRDFGGSAGAIGREIAVNGHRFTIVGVTPEKFLGVEQFVQPDVYLPHMMIQPVLETGSEALSNRAARNARLFARLKPGITIEQANEDISRISSQLEREYPETNKGTRAVVVTQYAYRVTNDPRLPRMALVFLTIGFLVLGIACVNVSNLLLSIVPARTREMAVRLAMGAPRTRLLRQLLLESTLLSGAGTVVGLLGATWCADLLSTIRLGAAISDGLQTRMDERVVIFTIAVGFVSAFMSGAIPAWRCSRGDLNSLLKTSDPRNRPQKTWGRQLLVGAQVAVASVFLVFAAFLVKDLRIGATRPPGFRLDHLLTMSLNPYMAGYDLEKSRGFYTDLVERVRSMPGVRSAAIAQDKPFGTMNSGSTNVTIDGFQLPAAQKSIQTRSAFVGDGYFQTLDISIVRGRAFDRRDSATAPRTVIVNETMAQRYWPGREAIGSHVEILGDDGGPAEVIGIARNAKYGALTEPPLPFLYRSYSQGSETFAALFIETEGSPEALTSAIRSELHNIAPNMPVFDMRTMLDYFRENGLLEARLAVKVFMPLTAVALILGVLGLYGVIAYSVGQRTYEIGIRMALGASARHVLRMVLFHGLRSSGIAAVAGIGIAFALSGVTAENAANVNPYDLTICLGVLIFMLVVTGVACYIPARRASMVDPNLTLRN